MDYHIVLHAPNKYFSQILDSKWNPFNRRPTLDQLAIIYGFTLHLILWCNVWVKLAFTYVMRYRFFIHNIRTNICVSCCSPSTCISLYMAIIFIFFARINC